MDSCCWVFCLRTLERGQLLLLQCLHPTPDDTASKGAVCAVSFKRARVFTGARVEPYMYIGLFTSGFFRLLKVHSGKINRAYLFRFNFIQLNVKDDEYRVAKTASLYEYWPRYPKGKCLIGCDK